MIAQGLRIPRYFFLYLQTLRLSTHSCLITEFKHGWAWKKYIKCYGPQTNAGWNSSHVTLSIFHRCLTLGSALCCCVFCLRFFIFSSSSLVALFSCLFFFSRVLTKPAGLAGDSAVLPPLPLGVRTREPGALEELLTWALCCLGFSSSSASSILNFCVASHFLFTLKHSCLKPDLTISPSRCRNAA